MGCLMEMKDVGGEIWRVVVLKYFFDKGIVIVFDVRLWKKKMVGGFFNGFL